MGGVVPAWQTGTAAAGGAIVTVPGGQARQVALTPPTPFAYTGAPAHTYCFLRSTQTMRQRPANACVSTHDWRGELRRGGGGFWVVNPPWTSMTERGRTSLSKSRR